MGKINGALKDTFQSLWKYFFPSAEWFWSQVNELDLWNCLINIGVFFMFFFSSSVKGSLQTLPAQPIEIHLLELRTLEADQLQHFSVFNFFSRLANLVIWKDFPNLFSQIINWQCFHNKRNKCSHSLRPPPHSSKSIIKSSSQYHGSFQLLFMTNLKSAF